MVSHNLFSMSDRNSVNVFLGRELEWQPAANDLWQSDVGVNQCTNVIHWSVSEVSTDRDSN